MNADRRQGAPFVAEAPDAIGAYPTLRPRRNRRDAWTRRLVAENTLSVDDLIWPIFVIEGADAERAVASMPGQVRVTVDRVAKHVEQAARLGIPAIAIFPATPPEAKDAEGTEALNPDNLICRAARELKRHFPEIGLVGDVALDPYTDHGHDGVIRATRTGDYVHNDDTVAILVRQAVNQAEAGIDVIAPSDMMDGRVGAIRAALDAEGYTDIPIMAYSAKYASAYYGPFREAADSAPAFGDRKAYQMDPANGDEALRETALDIAEGADIVMVKPALAYMDIIRRVKDEFGYPTAAYNVSGEYALVKAAAANGWVDEKRIVLETLTAFKRAGADLILTYHAKDAARWLAEDRA